MINAPLTDVSPELIPDRYLRDQNEMSIAIDFLLDSELFEFYRERMVGIMMGDAQEVSSPPDSLPS